MSGNDCFCEKCGTHHHPMAECFVETRTKLELGPRLKALAKLFKRKL